MPTTAVNFAEEELNARQIAVDAPQLKTVAEDQLASCLLYEEDEHAPAS